MRGKKVERQRPVAEMDEARRSGQRWRGSQPTDKVKDIQFGNQRVHHPLRDGP